MRLGSVSLPNRLFFNRYGTLNFRAPGVFEREKYKRQGAYSGKDGIYILKNRFRNTTHCLKTKIGSVKQCRLKMLTSSKRTNI